MLKGLKTSADEVRKGDWVQTYTGKKFWPLDPRPEEIDINDIAHSLALTCRFGGHCKEFYSVAQHCIIASEYAGKDSVLSLWLLLHDASEAYLHDITSPLKPYLPKYKDFEARIMDTVAIAFNLPSLSGEIEPKIKIVDKRLLARECELLMEEPPDEWGSCEGFSPLPVEIKPMTPKQAEKGFIKRYRDITRRRRNEKADRS